MSLAFPDVNVWLALTIQHVHERAALDWWQGETGPIGFCRFTQMGLLRLLTTFQIMNGRPLTMKQAWKVYDSLAGDDRVDFFEEPATLEPVFRGFTSGTHASPKLWADAYLASFAVECGARVVTFDRALSRRARQSLLLG